MVELLVQWLLSSFFQQSNTSSQETATSTAELVRVIDGDTITVRVNGVIEKVRYLNIDTPESLPDAEPECFATEATAANQQLLGDGQLILVADKRNRDDYNRLLRHVYVGDTSVNAELLAGGYATTLIIPPNTYLASQYRQIENQARENESGLWGACRD
jgi:micrococcal nuclease